MIDSPQIISISSGIKYKTKIKKITIKDNNLEITVDSTKVNDNDIQSACIKIYNNKKTPNFSNLDIKNNNSVFNAITSQDNSGIEKSGIISGTNISYNISKNCSVNDLDLSNKGYYKIKHNDEDKLDYIISLGSYHGGCHGFGVDSIGYDSKNNNITLTVSDYIPPILCSDPLADKSYKLNIYLCIELYNIKDHNTSINNIDIDNALEPLELLDEKELTN